MKGKRFTEQDLQKLSDKGLKVEGFRQRPEMKQKSIAQFKKKPKALQYMEQMLYVLGVPYETEYKFHETRMFRFDLAIVEYKIAIEYEGIMQEDKSRHTTVQGFTNDCTKYNLAQIAGWRVLRYTAANYKDFIIELKELINI